MEKEKKSWLKNLIFEEDPKAAEKQNNTAKAEPQRPVEQPAPAVQQPVAAKVNTTPPPKEPSLTSSLLAGEGKVDQNLLNKLCAVLDSNQMKGIDYVKFKKSVDSLAALQADENMRFATAFMALKATNPELSKDYLLQTTDKYIALMEREREVGVNQLASLKQNGIENKEKEIQSAVKKVEELKAEINKLNEFITRESAEIAGKKEEFTAKELNFNLTVDKIVNQLKEDRDKIQNLIQ